MPEELRAVPVRADGPPKCDEEVFNKGVAVHVGGGLDGWTTEAVCQLARELFRDAKIKIDWHFAGGRAVFLALTRDAELRDRARAVVTNLYQAALAAAREARG